MKDVVLGIPLLWIAGSAAIGIVSSIAAWWWSRLRKEKRRAEQPVKEKGAEASGATSSPLESCRDLVDSLWMAINLGPPVDREILFDQVVGRFACWVGDLPASESYHHSERAGLLEHSLESALGAVRRVREIHLRYHDAKGEEDPVSAYRASEVWRYAAFLFGLFHDIGKCLSVTAKTEQGDAWNGFVEGLEDFSERAGGRDRIQVRFVPGRGLAEHEALTDWLMGRILPDEAVAFARRFGVLEDILKTADGFAVVGARGENARQFLERVKGGDTASVERYVKRRLAVQAQPTSQRVAEPPVVPAAAPNGSARLPFAPVATLRRVDHFFFAALERALAGKELAVNSPGADAYVGSKFLCAVYPECFVKLIEAMKRDFGGEPDVRGLLGPSDLVSLLKLNAGAVYVQPKEGFWKVRFQADYGADAPRMREGEAVLLFLEKLPPGCRKEIEAIGRAPAAWSFRFLGKSDDLEIGDLKGDGANTYDGRAIIDALKEALMQGQLCATMPLRQVFVAHKQTHFVVPVALDVIFGREEVARAWNMNRMLDAMMRTGWVMPGPGGRAVVTIQVGAMKGTVDAVAIDTQKLFTWEEMGKLEADGKTCNDAIKTVEKLSG